MLRQTDRNQYPNHDGERRAPGESARDRDFFAFRIGHRAKPPHRARQDAASDDRRTETGGRWETECHGTFAPDVMVPLHEATTGDPHRVQTLHRKPSSNRTIQSSASTRTSKRLPSRQTGHSSSERNAPCGRAVRQSLRRLPILLNDIAAFRPGRHSRVTAKQRWT